MYLLFLFSNYNWIHINKLIKLILSMEFPSQPWANLPKARASGAAAVGGRGKTAQHFQKSLQWEV